MCDVGAVVTPNTVAASGRLRLPLVRRLIADGALDRAQGFLDALAPDLAEDPQFQVLTAELAWHHGRDRQAYDQFAELCGRSSLRPPVAVAAASGLGSALFGLGDLGAASDHLTRAIAAGATDARSWLLSAQCLLAARRWPELDDLAERAQNRVDIDPLAAAATHMTAAVAGVVRDRPDLCQGWLDRTQPRQARDHHDLVRSMTAWRQVIRDRIGAVTTRDRRLLAGALSYPDYLAALLAFRASNADLYDSATTAPLHVIGDSHCLAPAHTVVRLQGCHRRVVPHLVIGAKVWHLAPRLNPAPNPSRAIFADIVGSLPPHEPVVTMFGEIDSRPDEGLLPYLRGHPDVDPALYCQQLAAAHVGHVAAALAASTRQVMIWGIPAPAAAQSNRAGVPAQTHRDMVAQFNTALGAAARAHQLVFLDPYPDTADQVGSANDKWHLDGIHVPATLFATLIEALRLS